MEDGELTTLGADAERAKLEAGVAVDMRSETCLGCQMMKWPPLELRSRAVATELLDGLRRARSALLLLPNPTRTVDRRVSCLRTLSRGKLPNGCSG